MSKGVDHIAIVVLDLEQALAVYRDALGLRCESVQDIPSEQIRAAFLSGGNSDIELIQPITPDSGVAKYLAARGEGLHHICLNVDDLDATLAALAAQGIGLTGGGARPGAHGRVAFVHPKSANGVLIELLERGNGLADPHSGD